MATSKPTKPPVALPAKKAGFPAKSLGKAHPVPAKPQKRKGK